MSFFNVEDKITVFSPASNTITSSTMENPPEIYTPPDNMGCIEVSALASSLQGRSLEEMNSFLTQQEPRAGDVAPSTIGTATDEEWLANLRRGNMMTEDVPDHSAADSLLGNAGGESSAYSGLWGDSSVASSSAGSRNTEMIDTFDFLVKSISSANNYVSMLTREQLAVLRSIRPSLLYEFLQEVAKVRSDKRMRRAMPNECAFCKNNGENEDCYSSHALKDWRGRVLCPVLRAFRCPRCGSTGDRAHTIKYCPENGDNVLERSGSFQSRRRGSSTTSSFLFGAGSQQSATPSMPSPSQSTASLSQPPIWNPYNL